MPWNYKEIVGMGDYGSPKGFFIFIFYLIIKEPFMSKALRTLCGDPKASSNNYCWVNSGYHQL